MMRGVTPVAECDQVARIIDASRGAGNQMMNVGFAARAFLAALSASVRVTRENDGASGAPLLRLYLGRRQI